MPMSMFAFALYSAIIINTSGSKAGQRCSDCDDHIASHHIASIEEANPLSTFNYSLPPPTIQPTTNCNITLSNHSIRYIKSRLTAFRPNFMHIKIEFADNHRFNATPDTFQPNHWVWTYKSASGIYPYLFWNIDYGLLSFGLLQVKTLPTIPFILLNISKECEIIFGTRNTTKAMAKAFMELTHDIGGNNFDMSPKYEKSYYCFLAETPGIRDSLQYQAAIYFMYPVNFINYNCCVTEYNYTSDKFMVNCLDHQMKKWPQCTIIPYILGIIIFLYFPITAFKFCAWMSTEEVSKPSASEIFNHDTEPLTEAESFNCVVENSDDVTKTEDDDWLYLDGSPPRRFLDIFNTVWCGLDKSYPVLVARIRRFLLVLCLPIVVYVQIWVYFINMEPGIVSKLVKHGNPMGFLALLGERKDYIKMLSPLFGGPMCILITQYCIGIIFIVIPKNLKQIIETGIPPIACLEGKSPLFLSSQEIKRLSMVSTETDPGYENAASICKCSLYMIFNKQFWKRAVEIQRNRVFISTRKPWCLKATKVALLPIYAVFCLIEYVLCILFYGIPLLTCVTVVIKGATRSLLCMRMRENKEQRNVFLNNPVSVSIGSTIIFAMFLYYAYAICLIFVESFSFISRVVMFCFIAVIVYPAVAFGYLFFVVVLLYYIVRLIRDFGYTYLELLSEAVEISRNLDGHPNYVTTLHDNLIISNVKSFRIKYISINNKVIPIPQNVLQSIFQGNAGIVKMKLKNNIYGIPKRLFDSLIKKHRPVHQQVLKIAFELMLISLLLVITVSICAGFITGPTSEISDVMHVVFIVSVGALPRVLEVAMSNASESVKKEIELRRMEESVIEYWTLERNRISIN